MNTGRNIWRAVVVAVAFLGASPGLALAQGNPTGFLIPVKATWETTRGLVVGLIEAMPEDKWDFKPTPAVRSYREVVTHLVGENYLFFGRIAGESHPNPAQSLKTKDELVKAVKDSYEY